MNSRRVTFFAVSFLAFASTHCSDDDKVPFLGDDVGDASSSGGLVGSSSGGSSSGGKSAGGSSSGGKASTGGGQSAGGSGSGGEAAGTGGTNANSGGASSGGESNSGGASSGGSSNSGGASSGGASSGGASSGGASSGGASSGGESNSGGASSGGASSGGADAGTGQGGSDAGIPGSGGVTSGGDPDAGNPDAGATPVVVINEVESDGNDGDWVELYNAGNAPADISGWTFLDSDDSHTPYAIPASTTLAPGGFYVLTDAQFIFGLGGADSVRLFDGTTLAASFSWTAHAVNTYGRCPDGAGTTLVQTAAPTKGTSNDCTPADSGTN